ncbi:hypothetical protein O3W44_02670 [Pantoea sp. LMR881]|uniref:hypothetical protein n=1 Tax=Pantoea sp. LMR881 TaxID=3014336 RepID=UPI0022AF5B62|nr:hypothetical protein [Pantoea sp. LMR881]MCZ4058235.1 hypothetical protein [Pantoea sp. LMR881]
MKHNKESNVGRMPELTDFGLIYSALGKLIVVDLVMEDSLKGHVDYPQDFPDLKLSMRSDMARELAKALLDCADAIDAGMHHPSVKIMN